MEAANREERVSFTRMMNSDAESLRKDVIDSGILLEDAKKHYEDFIKKKNMGTHPHILAAAIQKHRNNVNAGAHEIRRTFRIV